MKGMSDVGCMALMVVAFVIIAVIYGVQAFLSALFTSYLLYLVIAIIIGGDLLGRYQKNHRESKNGLYVAGALFAIVVGGYFYNSFFDSPSSPAVSRTRTVQNHPQSNDYRLDDETREIIEQDLRDVGMIPDAILASTIGHNKNGYLVVAKNGSDNCIIALDKKDDCVAMVMPLTPVSKIADSPVSTIDAIFVFPNHASDGDDAVGVRADPIHLIPVTCQYSDSKNGLAITSPVYALGKEETKHASSESDFINALKNAKIELHDQKKVEIINIYVSDVRLLDLAMKANQLSESSLITVAKAVNRPQGTTTKSAQNNNAVGMVNPETVFKNYHQFITQRQYQAAYNCLTPSFQSAMGDCQSWSQGYATTVSSVPDNIQVQSNDGNRAVLSFRLKAVDRIGTTEKTQYFTGTCTLLKVNGQWLIDEIMAQQA